MGCFDAGKSTKTKTTSLPAWLSKSAQSNVEKSQEIANRPYEAYTGDRVNPFTSDQNQSFEMMRGYSDQFANPSGRADAITEASNSGIMQYDMPRLIDNISGTGEAEGSIQDYMNPYIQSVLADTMGEMNRQGAIDQKGIDSGATMAGAFGDAGHGIQTAEHTRNLTEAKGRQMNLGLSEAFKQAMGMRESDLNRGLSTFNTNANLYEGGLDRAISGAGQASAVEGNDLNNLMKYIGGLSGMGAQQQEQGQMGLDVNYQDFLKEQGYDQEMLKMLNQTTSSQPYDKTTAVDTPTASKGAQGIGMAMQLASMFI